MADSDPKTKGQKEETKEKDAIEKYNSLFRFLFPIKRAQVELQHVWS